MLILAIDTSGRHGSVALCSGDSANVNVLARSELEGGTYSAKLVPCISDLLSQAGVSKTNIDGIAVVDGPGSFTGLRVGISTAKALCEILAKPLAAVSMLEALTITYGADGETVRAVLDAGRGELYVGEYRIEGQRAEMRSQYIAKLVDFQTGSSIRESRVITTFAKLGDIPNTSVLLVSPLQADTVAPIGLRKLLAGEVVDPAKFDANYIRRSDAELFSLPKH